MKRIFTLLSIVMLSVSAFAQTPDKISYQAVIRNNTNGLVTNSAIGMRVSIVQGSAGGTPVYVETHTPASNANGLVSVQIGGGTAVSGTFSAIDWGAGPYFIKSETDPLGGTNYTITGTTQLLSVPYALYSNTAQNVVNNDDADADTTNELQKLSLSNDTLSLTNGGGEILLSSSGWALKGNANTVDGTHFIGTMDNQPLNFRVNNQPSGKIEISAFNTSYGYQTLFNNTSGSNNSANGYKALHNNILGFNNTANGNEALYNNTGGYRNTANGHSALYSNTTGYLNSANGHSALYNNTTGYQNTANGYQTMFHNDTGRKNTANGYRALYFNTFGGQNVANGYEALYSSTTGTKNTANGVNTLYNNTTGSFNTADGYLALNDNTTGNYNVANGSYALFGNTTGSFNTAIGHYAYRTSSSYSNSSAMGYSVGITASNQIRLGDNNITSIGGFQNWSNVSDRRFKKDINENVPGLAFITQLRPVTYHLDMDAIAKGLNTPDSLRLKEREFLAAGMLHTGFIAQEVEKTAQALNYNFSGVDKPKNEADFYGLRYAEFTVPLVKAVQELNEQNKKQQETIALLLKRIEALEANK